MPLHALLCMQAVAVRCALCIGSTSSTASTHNMCFRIGWRRVDWQVARHTGNRYSPRKRHSQLSKIPDDYPQIRWAFPNADAVSAV